MNKTAIKKFAMEARKKLISDIKYKAGLLGITEKGIASALKQSNSEVEYYDIGTKEPYVIQGKQVYQRRSLANAIRTKAEAGDYKTAYNSIIEEVAYTWFNRLIAVRFMEVNDYLPCKIRVLSSDEGVPEPEIVQRPFESAMEFTAEEEQLVQKMALANEGEKLFRMLFVKECNELSDILPQLFEKQDDYTELLLNISYNDTEGVVYHLVHDIPEDDFNVEKGGQVEIIGWMYQYYNTEIKSAIEMKVEKGGKVLKEEIAPKTELFTPDWIVRYMVENSLGKLWVEGHPNDILKVDWKYYLEEPEQEESVKAELAKIREAYAQLNPEDIKLIDPCMGSGHILVYAFDVFMQIYLSVGYTQKEAVLSILENNLYGLDIDERAFQLSCFAIMMKARQYYKLVLKKQIKINLFFIEESNSLKNKLHQLKYFGSHMDELTKNIAINQIHEIIGQMKDAKEYGSLLDVDDFDWDLLNEFLEDLNLDGEMDLFSIYGIENTQIKLQNILDVASVLNHKYNITITNPPYLKLSSVNSILNSYVTEKYVNSKMDLYTAFIERCHKFCCKNGIVSMITMHGWMFLSTFLNLRKFVLRNDILSMVHLGARSFDEISGEVVQTTCFVFRNTNLRKYKALYSRIVLPRGEKAKEEYFLSKKGRYTVAKLKFDIVPLNRLSYWIDSEKIFGKHIIKDKFQSGGRNKTHNNNLYVRSWWEVNLHTTYWRHYDNGGSSRKWYGNCLDVVNWSDLAKKFYNSHGGLLKDEICGKRGISWNGVSGNIYSFKEKIKSFPFSSSSPTIISESDDNIDYTMGLLNSRVAPYILNALNPTLQLNVGEVLEFPINVDNTKLPQNILEIVNTNIEIAKSDWDCFEVSWNFVTHPLIVYKSMDRLYPVNEKGDFIGPVSYSIEESYRAWELNAKGHFDLLKRNEEELNRIFIDIYGLQDELTPDVEDKDVTVRLADKERDIKSLLSYAVGCMLGRYSLDVEGLAYAGGDWQEAWSSKYKTYIPDDDNVIPITDEDYFEDDIVGYLCKWLKVVYGEATLEQNLKFIADALGTAGDTPRKRIRNYFLKDFYKDHCKIYQKRPIYWLYDSGKQNGFKALVYMHRYDADTTGNIRVEYLSRMQNTYEAEIARMQDVIETGTPKEAGQAAKRQEKLKKQLKECRDYDAMIGHIALSRIELDLDDGVKVNYEKIQTSKQGEFLEILAKI